MQHHGRLEQTDAADVLRRAGDARETGRLDLRHGEVEARIWLQDGEVYSATAPQVRSRIGDRLVGALLIGEAELHHALREQRARTPRPRLGDLLVERGLVAADDLAQLLHEQVADSVAVVMGWRTGTWSFTAGDRREEDVPLRCSLENLLMEAARRQEELEVVWSRLGSAECVVDFARGATRDLSLTADEWALLTRVDGAATLGDIADESGYGQLPTARVIYGLLSAGVVTVCDPPPAPADRVAGTATSLTPPTGLRVGGSASPETAVSTAPSAPVEPARRRAGSAKRSLLQRLFG